MTIAFVDGTVFVGDGRILPKAVVVVDGERIVKVGAEHCPLPRNTRMVPLDGGVLLPGFIDCHVHLCLDGSPDPVTGILAEPMAMTAFKAAAAARRTLLAGVTTVRDLGGRAGIDLALKQAVQSGVIPGPRMLVSGRLICMTGGHGWQIGLEADGADAVRRAAREQIKAGADIIKLMATGGVLTPGVEPGNAQFTEAELRAGIEEAHKAGRKTATHAMGTQGILNALRAGIDSIEHGVYLDEEAVRMMAERRIAFIPTISALHHIDEKGAAAGIPDYAVEKTRAVKPHHLESIRLAREAGVAVAMGTDAGTPFNLHGQNLGELALLVDRGFSVLHALQAGTRVAAETLGLAEDLGTIEEGKLADLIVAPADVLEQIEVLLQPGAVRMVMQAGRVVRENGANVCNV